jgi:NADH dehydrogenase FAD-containing subunit
MKRSELGGTMGKHLVLVGGGHAHMTVLLNVDSYIQRGHRVTLIGPAPYHYYSGMGPGLLAGIYRPQDVRFHVRKMAEDRGGVFIQDRVVRVDAGRRTLVLKSDAEIEYDVVSFNTGSYVPADDTMPVLQTVYPVKPVENLVSARRAVLTRLTSGSPRLIVIGGGAAALEVCGNLWRLVRDNNGTAAISLLAGRRFLANLPEGARIRAVKSLVGRQIDIVEGVNVDHLADGCAVLEDGRDYRFDLALLAWGIRPSTLFRDSGLPTAADGGLLVNSYLQSVAHPEVFGGGDCISFKERPLDRVGVYAVRQNPILFQNLSAALEDRGLSEFHPQREYLLIFNLGDGRGIFWKRNWVWDGRLAFFLKDTIDRKFMRKFQVSGERSETRAQF